MWEAGQPFSRPIWISLQATFVNCCFQQRQILPPALSLTSPSSLYLPTGDPPHPHQLPVNAPVKFWIPVLASGAPLGVALVYLQALVNLYLPARVFCRLLHPCCVSCCSQLTDLTLGSFYCSQIKSPPNSTKLWDEISLFMIPAFCFPSLVCLFVRIRLYFSHFLPDCIPFRK